MRSTDAAIDPATRKEQLRARIRASRGARTDSELALSRAQIASEILDWCRAGAISAGSRIAAYVPMRTEPCSLELLDSLAAAGYEVIVPVTLPDNDLDWRAVDGHQLGVSAIETAALILVPAFAVDRTGGRLGRGGGSYDRALARVGTAGITAAMVFSDELVAEVPVQSWDRPVDAVFAPSWLRCTRQD
jgi:5-formyltetrahydrofolate cyclo-ligase